MNALLRTLVISLSIAAAGGALCSGQGTQSGTPQTETSNDGAASQKKAKRVWTEDDLQQLSGPVNVVGQESKPAVSEQRPAANAAPLSRYRLDFTARTIDGSLITEEETKGKVLLVQFWATWCPHSRNDQIPVDRVYSDLASRGLVVIAVDVGESEADLKKYLSQNPRYPPVVMGKNTDLTALRPNSSGVPTYVVVDRNGNVVGSRTGELGEAGLRRLLQKAGM